MMEQLIEHNLRLCAHIARKYTVAGCDQDDLISIGTIGLIKGINTFTPDGGTQLSTYCTRCIENPMSGQDEQVRQWRISLGKNYKEMGEYLGVATSNVISWEREEKIITKTLYGCCFGFNRVRKD